MSLTLAPDGPNSSRLPCCAPGSTSEGYCGAHVSMTASNTTHQCGRNQGHHLVARVRPARRIAQVEALLDEFGQAEAQGQGGRQDQSGLANRRRSSKGIWIRSGWLRGSIYWVLLVLGSVCGYKTIIPESQEHLLAASGR